MWYEDFAERVTRDQDLRELTSVRVGGRARWFVVPASENELGELLKCLAGEGLDHRVLGGGSNLLAPDEDLEDVIVHPAALRAFEAEGEQVRVQSGLPLSALVVRSNQLGLAGAHVLAGIPGQVGGALVMNAGGRYGEIGPLVGRVHVRLKGGTRAVLEPEDLDFGYRQTRIPAGAIITSVDLKLKATGDARALRRESARIVKEKNAAQPTSAANFGCMFQNPPGRSAGILIDQAGLKGTTCGGARISLRHGNFVENLGQARARDVLALIEQAEEAVLKCHGIALVREVRIWRC